jgi:dipeptidyl-peptidase-4
MADSFPRQEARTRRFTLGVPRAFRVSPDGRRVAYLRTKSGSDPVTCLWVLDVGTGEERLAADPRTLLPGAADEEDLPPQERARRERVRELAGGIVAYATDERVSLAVFALSGRVYAVRLDGGGAPRQVPTRTPALDPRPDPAGRRLAYVCAGALRVTGLAGGGGAGGGGDRALADPGGAAHVTFGLPEFIAAEEMGRVRGYWWAPDGSALLVARVDESPVARWHIADPANPGRPPAEAAYPAAGTPNAEVSLLLAALDGTTTAVDTGGGAFPYMVTARWQDGHDPLAVVQSRDQRRMRLLGIDPATGKAGVLREDADPRWLEIVPGVPAWTGDGRIAWTQDAADTRCLVLVTPGGGDPEPVTPPGLQVAAVLGTDGDTVLFQASAEPTETALWAYGPGGLRRVSDGPGVHGGAMAGGTAVVASRSLDDDGVTVRVHRDGTPERGIASLAETPALPPPRPVLASLGPRQVRTAVLFPSWHQPGSGKLPVLLLPYGGPHGQRVVKARGAYLGAQWFAEQGFAVVIADGRGTPGRGPAWERAVAGDLAGPVLDDQVDALGEAASRFADLDAGRVGIAGWSFGGYLAALAVLRRPDVFHAAVAGAPVTDWRLYDTHYTERYLGLPDARNDAYGRCSLISLAERAVATRRRPLLLIHGLADDNVVVAHTLRLSAALLAAGYPHAVLPLSGITHVAAQETVAENLLLLQLDFLRRSLSDVQQDEARVHGGPR